MINKEEKNYIESKHNLMSNIELLECYIKDLISIKKDAFNSSVDFNIHYNYGPDEQSFKVTTVDNKIRYKVVDVLIEHFKKELKQQEAKFKNLKLEVSK